MLEKNYKMFGKGDNKYIGMLSIFVKVYDASFGNIFYGIDTKYHHFAG